MLVAMMYDVLCWSVEKAVMLLPGLESPEGGNIRGIYGVLAGLRCWYCYCCLGGFRLDCPFWDFCYCSVTGRGECSLVVVCVCVCVCA